MPTGRHQRSWGRSATRPGQRVCTGPQEVREGHQKFRVVQSYVTQEGNTYR
jgi:hypothetical protein